MYPPGFQTHVEPGPLAEPMEGAGRPGHFRGVATVVTKLFLAVRPDVAVFGQKDFQQLAIVRRMATDLDFGIEVVGVPTVREPDGLAMSSRNRRLAPDDLRPPSVCPGTATAAARGSRRRDARAARLVAGRGTDRPAEPWPAWSTRRSCDPVSLERVDPSTGRRSSPSRSGSATSA